MKLSSIIFASMAALALGEEYVSYSGLAKCPAGSEVAEGECLAAGKALYPDLKTKLSPGMHNTYPCGCFHNPLKFWMLFNDEGANCGAKAPYEVVCKNPAPADGASLANKWLIQPPDAPAYAGNKLDLLFGVSTAFAGAFNVVFYDKDCSAGASPEANPIEIDASTLGIASTSAGSGLTLDALTSDSEVPVSIVIDPANIVNTDIVDLYKEVGSDAEISFCVRLELTTLDGTVEVNFLETVVTISADLTDDFQFTGVNVTPKEKAAADATQDNQVTGYRCDDNNELITTAAADINQGTVVKICVKPVGDSPTTGLYMSSIDSFNWVKAVTVDGVTPAASQAAITTGGPADGLTILGAACQGQAICSFETLLKADFFATAGQVTGSGAATMQYGAGTDQRRLRSGDRNLQDDVAGASEFDVELTIAKEEDAASGASGMSMVMVFLAGVAGLF